MKNLHSFPAFDNSKNMLWQQNRPSDSFENNESADKTDTLDAGLQKINAIGSSQIGKEAIKKNVKLDTESTIITSKFEGFVGGIGLPGTTVEEKRQANKKQIDDNKKQGVNEKKDWGKETTSELDAYKQRVKAEQAEWGTQVRKEMSGKNENVSSNLKGVTAYNDFSLPSVDADLYSPASINDVNNEFSFMIKMGQAMIKNNPDSADYMTTQLEDTIKQYEFFKSDLKNNSLPARFSFNDKTFDISPTS